MLLAFWIFQSTRPHGGATEHEPPVCCGRIISIHAPAWGRDVITSLLQNTPSNFNPRARMGARPMWSTSTIRRPAFQSTRPHGGATILRRPLCSPAPFQSTRPHGGATHAQIADMPPSKFQSTRPHGGATTGSLHLLQVPSISIHAPAWGRDDFHGGLGYQTHDFNPRARMGARPAAIAACCDCSQFQSTRPHGGATALFHGAEQSSAISIHAPAWGRDSAHFFRSSASCRFQSTRPHGGATHGICRRRFRRWDFNPRARMGARLLAHPASAAYGHFNPRARMGARPQLISFSQALCHFNPRARMGARPAFYYLYRHSPISIHAPAWGRDAGTRARSRGHADFNPRARMGARLTLPCSLLEINIFQSTRPHGGATFLAHPRCRHCNISIHAPAWGRDTYG